MIECLTNHTEVELVRSNAFLASKKHMHSYMTMGARSSICKAETYYGGDYHEDMRFLADDLVTVSIHNSLNITQTYITTRKI